MKKTKNTKRALIASVLVTILCISMLVGSTFAWFTDSVTSGNNIIQSGNLDMELSFKPYGADKEWTKVTNDTQIFGKDAKYEPGYTNAVWLRVDNVGSLAFRYNLILNVAEEIAGINQAGDKFNLSDYLDVMYLNTTSTDMETNFYTTRESLDSFAWGAAANSGVTEFKNEVAFINNGTAYPAEEGKEAVPSYVLVVVQMPTTVGNEANHNGIDLPEIKFSLTALATQLTYEEDSFDNQYDANATYPVASTDDLTKAIEDAQDGDIINLAKGTFELPTEIDKAITFVGAGEETTIIADVPDGGDLEKETAAINVKADNVTIKNMVFDAKNGNSGSFILSTGENLTVENCIFDMRDTNDAGIYLFNNDSATIRNCEFINGYKSIYVNGKDVDTDTDTDELLIEDCTFEGVYALHVGGSTNVVANRCVFNGMGTTLWNGTATYNNCDFNNGSYNQLLNYYASPVIFNDCFIGSNFTYAVRQAKNEVKTVVNNASYATDEDNFAKHSEWAVVTDGEITYYTVTEDGSETKINK